MITRLATREYLPMVGWLGTWAMLAVALGHADTVRLLAANTFLQALRALCTVEMTAAIGQRIGRPQALAVSRGRALRIDLLVLGAALLLAALLAGALYARGAAELAIMLAAVTVGLPARHPGMVIIAGRNHAVTWRAGVAMASLGGGAATLLLGLDWWWAALLFGARDWGGLLLSLLAAKPREAAEVPSEQPLRFAEVAARTEYLARRRITYRLAKGVLGAALGPFGTVVARTGRGFRLDSKLSRLVPRHRGGMAFFTLVTATIAAGLIALSREPFLLFLAANSLRLAGSAGSALLWWNYGSAIAVDDDADDD